MQKNKGAGLSGLSLELLAVGAQAIPQPYNTYVSSIAALAGLGMLSWWFFANFRVISPIVAREQFDDSPRPIFGSPRQEAKESYRAWWHIPIMVSESKGVNKIENATADFVRLDPGADVPTISLQWQDWNNPSGVRERDLVEGRTFLIPLALRDDPKEKSDGYRASLTGSQWLRSNGATDTFPLKPTPRFLFKIRIRSGKKYWDSPHSYMLKVPADGAGNSQFAVQIWGDTGD